MFMSERTIKLNGEEVKGNVKGKKERRNGIVSRIVSKNNKHD